jgi:hypothetical protein
VLNDVKIDLELQSCIATKGPNVTCRDIPTIKDIMDAHSGATSLAVNMSSTKLSIDTSRLEDAAYQYLIAQIDTDVTSIRRHVLDLSNFSRAQARPTPPHPNPPRPTPPHTTPHPTPPHPAPPNITGHPTPPHPTPPHPTPTATAQVSKQQQWNLGQHKHSLEAANAYFDMNCKVVLGKTAEEFATAYLKFRSDCVKSFGLLEEKLATVGYCNWVAPCTISSENLTLQSNLLALVSNSGDQNISLVLMPQWAYKKGQLFLCENTVRKLLTERSLNIDLKYALIFNEKKDTRDLRPLMYDGRIIVPTGGVPSNFFFKKSDILSGKVDVCQQVHSRDMVQIEEISEKVLPSSTDIDGGVRGASKFSQVGSDAVTKMFEVTTTTPSVTKSKEGDAIQYGSMRFNTVRHDTLRNYTIRLDAIRYDSIRFDTIRCDTTRCDAIRHDTIRRDSTQYDSTRYESTRYDSIRFDDAIQSDYDSIRFDTIRHDSIRCESIRFDAIRHDAIRYESIRFDTIRCDAIQSDTIRASNIHVSGHQYRHHHQHQHQHLHLLTLSTTTPITTAGDDRRDRLVSDGRPEWDHRLLHERRQLLP